MAMTLLAPLNKFGRAPASHPFCRHVCHIVIKFPEYIYPANNFSMHSANNVSLLLLRVQLHIHACVKQYCLQYIQAIHVYLTRTRNAPVVLGTFLVDIHT